MTTKFQFGQVLATPGALEALNESGQEPGFFLEKHLAGDWGEVGPEDWQENELSVQEGFRILSAYRTLKGGKLWIITEADRSATTFCCPTNTSEMRAGQVCTLALLNP